MLLSAATTLGFTGLMILAAFGVKAATGSSVWFDYVAFGPFFGPHVAFAGGAAASSLCGKQEALHVVPNAHLSNSATWPRPAKMSASRWPA